VIEVRGLVHVYPEGTRALDGVDLAIAAGERVAIVGQNGSGKSTLVRHLNGLLRPTEGVIRVDNRETAGRRVADLAATVGLAFQDPDRQIFAGKVRDEVAFGPRNLGLGLDDVVERVETALAALRVAALAPRDPERLSGGQAQLVGIASLLAMRPRHVILDEPTAQLDPAGTRLVGEALRTLAGTGTSLLIAEHKTDLLDGLCSRIVVLHGGRIVRQGPTGEVFDDPGLASLGVELPARARLTRALAERHLDTGVVSQAFSPAAS
jgi:cobalt/nickel transport system ATP-binding protein